MTDLPGEHPLPHPELQGGSSPYWTVLDSCCKCPIARNSMIALVAGGGTTDLWVMSPLMAERTYKSRELQPRKHCI